MIDINGGKVKTIQTTNWVRGMVLFDLFMFLWWINVIFQFGNLLLSYSVCTWFFTKRKETVSVNNFSQCAFNVNTRFQPGGSSSIS